MPSRAKPFRLRNCPDKCSTVDGTGHMWKNWSKWERKCVYCVLPFCLTVKDVVHIQLSQFWRSHEKSHVVVECCGRRIWHLFTRAERINDMRSVTAHFITELLSHRLRCSSIFLEFIWFLDDRIDAGGACVWLTVTPSMSRAVYLYMYWFCCRKQNIWDVWKRLKI